MPKSVQAYLEFEGAPLYFDCVTDESLAHGAEVTEHPVEEGANVADHIRNVSDEIKLTIITTNTPIKPDVNNLYNGQVAGLELAVKKYDRPIVPMPGALMSAGLNYLGTLLNPQDPWKAVTLQFPEKFNNVAFILGTLLDYKERGVVGKVITPHRTYETMAITKIDMHRDNKTGDAGEITLSLKAIRFVDTASINAPVPTETRGKKTTAKGKQGTDTVTQPKQSQFHKLFGKKKPT
jgi:hypothetical protein